MGIVYSIVIKPRKKFYLKQQLWVATWEVVQEKLHNRDFFHQVGPDWIPVKPINEAKQEYPPTRAQVFVNPYITRNFLTDTDTHTCVVQTQVEITEAEYAGLKKQVRDHPVNKILALFQDIKTNGVKEVLHEATIGSEDKDSILEEISTDALLLLLNDFPLLTPMFLDISLIVLLSGSGKFGNSYEVMNQGKLAIKNAGYSAEPGFAVDKNDNFIKGVLEIIRIVALSEKEGASYLTSPLCMRFVQASPEYLSPEYQVDTCMIEVPLMLGTIGDNQMLDRMQLDLLALGARPHWGKICNLVNGDDLVRKMYPRYQSFLDTVNFFNPKGTFNSRFSLRTGISKMKYERT
jgi:hypothetical protein